MAELNPIPPLSPPSPLPLLPPPSPPPPALHPPSPPNSTPHLATQTQPLAPKRQRRPSVRLGDIGPPEPATLDQPTTFRRPKTSWHFHKDPTAALKTSSSRPLTNLVNHKNNNGPFLDRFDYSAETATPKPKKPIKRPRTNCTTPAAVHEDELEGYESPLHSTESLQFRGVRVSECSRGHHHEGENNSGEEFRSSGSVKDWLAGMGLGRYGPLFQIHEVDDEVLPMLTLEDLKDMGINAVGSRRKIYAAIEKLQKEFL